MLSQACTARGYIIQEPLNFRFFGRGWGYRMVIRDTKRVAGTSLPARLNFGPSRQRNPHRLSAARNHAVLAEYQHSCEPLCLCRMSLRDNRKQQHCSRSIDFHVTATSQISAAPPQRDMSAENFVIECVVRPPRGTPAAWQVKVRRGGWRASQSETTRQGAAQCRQLLHESQREETFPFHP